MAAYSLPDLPYDYDALEPRISAETLEVHHDRIHRRYVERLNEALERTDQLRSLAQQSVEDLLRNFGRIPQGSRSAVRNHGGGHANHSMFWTSLSPDGGDAPSGGLATAVDGEFGSFGEFRQRFTDVATNHFGGGWTWLVHVNDRLVVYSLPHEDTPLTADEEPLLGLDLWEHAYYLDHQSDRAAYVESLWDVVDWDEIGRRFEKAGQHA